MQEVAKWVRVSYDGCGRVEIGVVGAVGRVEVGLGRGRGRVGGGGGALRRI